MIKYPQGCARVGEDEQPNGQIPETTTPEIRTTNLKVCSCGKSCKNERGLKIHRTKMGCQPILNLVQRKGQPHETEEEMDQETHHSVQHLHVQGEEEDGSNRTEEENETTLNLIDQQAEQTPTPTVEKTPQHTRERIKWPNSSKKNIWSRFEEELDKVLESTLAGNVDRKLSAMSIIIYSMGKERFGCEAREQKIKSDARVNRRQAEIAKMRQELRQFTKLYQKATTDAKKKGLKDLQQNHRERIKTLRRAENIRNNRRARMQARARFTANPFGFVKKLLGETDLDG